MDSCNLHTYTLLQHLQVMIEIPCDANSKSLLNTEIQLTRHKIRQSSWGNDKDSRGLHRKTSHVSSSHRKHLLSLSLGPARQNVVIARRQMAISGTSCQKSSTLDCKNGWKKVLRTSINEFPLVAWVHLKVVLLLIRCGLNTQTNCPEESSNNVGRPQPCHSSPTLHIHPHSQTEMQG